MPRGGVRPPAAAMPPSPPPGEIIPKIIYGGYPILVQPHPYNWTRMNEKTISSDKAAQQCPPRTAWSHHWVTGQVVMKHFGFCERTLRKLVKHDMPKHLIGTKRMRFVLREVYAWLVKEGALRFAAIGLANTLRESCAEKTGCPPPTTVSVTAPAGLTVTDSPLANSSATSFDQAITSIVAEPKALRKLQTKPTTKSSIAPPRCKPGRKKQTQGPLPKRQPSLAHLRPQPHLRGLPLRRATHPMNTRAYSRRSLRCSIQCFSKRSITVDCSPLSLGLRRRLEHRGRCERNARQCRPQGRARGQRASPLSRRAWSQPRKG